MDDQQAVTRLKRRDIKGLTALIERYQVRAVRTAFLITQDAALAEDVVQEAFVTAYHSIGTFDAQRPFAPWFMRIVVNSAIRATRRRQNHVSLDEDDDLESPAYLIDPAPGPDVLIETAEDEAVIWAALGRLSPERRAVIVLKFYLDLSENEMADHLSIPVGTVKSRLFAAKQQLREQLRGAKTNERSQAIPD